MCRICGYPTGGSATYSIAPASTTFSLGELANPGMAEHVRRAVDDYVATLGEVEDDAATVVELIQRGESWHISISAGAMHYENAEPSLPAALEAVGRVLAEKIVGSCAEVPTVEKLTCWSGGLVAGALLDQVAYVSPNRDGSSRAVTARDIIRDAECRAAVLASLPPCQITDSEALAKLTPAKVRAYLSGKGWTLAGQQPYGLPPQWASSIYRVSETDHFDVLRGCAFVEGRSAAAVYLDILAAEPGD